MNTDVLTHDMTHQLGEHATHPIEPQSEVLRRATRYLFSVALIQDGLNRLRGGLRCVTAQLQVQLLKALLQDQTTFGVV
jgi:hypothetical protein